MRSPTIHAKIPSPRGFIALHIQILFCNPQRVATHPAPPLLASPRSDKNLVARGLTNTEIGAELWITQNSVKQALKRMFRKLAVSSRTEMTAKLRNRLQG
ncbi:MAG: helix-turn-helix transcriptional regulator [Leptolyngbyaceae cyanobacterium MO_188.B28]|nr:helix-turn-helix transcriptional regulator [Leptolyngbyaceae cyanobacterium MO_188.B28]